ncbi:MAG: trehalose-phosphatase [Myxococcota bacterium]
MTTLLWDSWAEVGPRLSEARPLLACFDYDGTLTPIVANVEDAIATEEVRQALRQMSSNEGVVGAVVSGRTMNSLMGLVPREALWLIGHHGLSVRSPQGELSCLIDLEEAERQLEPLRATGRRIVAESPGLRLEDKGAGLALHTRNASRQAAERAAAAFCKEAEKLDGFSLLRGKEVYEVRPAGADKGRAILSLRQKAAPGSLVLYVGDDTTDEDAFQALRDLPAITVKVSEDVVATAAQYRVQDTEDVLDLLRRISLER